MANDVRKYATDGERDASRHEKNEPTRGQAEYESEKRPEEYPLAPGIDVDGKSDLELILFQRQPLAETFELRFGLRRHG